MPIYRNWADAAEYAFCEELDYLGWAWEFLRRNEDYQRDWLIEIKRYFRTDVRVLVKDDREGNRALLQEECDTSDIKIARKEGKRWKWINDPYFSFLPPGRFEIDYFQKYGIAFFVNPKQDNPYPHIFVLSEIFMENSLTLACSFHADEKKLEEIGRGRYFKLEMPIDLDLPIDPQIYKIKKYLLWHKRKRKRGRSKTSLRPESWQTYLRIIDARRFSPKITYKEIANIVYNDIDISSAESKARKAHEAALKIVNFGYREIAIKGLLGITPNKRK